MVTGFNTDIDHEERVFHVQTEDKGRGNPVIETLVYCGGAIIESRRSSYAEPGSEDGVSEEQIHELMEAQHQAMIREIRNGKFDLEGPKPFGHNIISSRSLDEVAFEFLQSVDRLDGLVLVLVEEPRLLQGTSPALRLKVAERGSQRPVANAQVELRLISTHDDPRELCQALSNDEGIVEARFEIPELAGADMAVVCRAQVAGHRAEIRQMVHRPIPRRVSVERA